MSVESNKNSSSSQQHCGHCGKTEEPLQKCSRCRSVAYCSRYCQKKDWKAGHKEACGTTSTTTTSVVAGNSTTTAMAGSGGNGTVNRVDNDEFDSGCNCPECNGARVAGLPVALFRTTVPGGVKWFTGIVSYGNMDRRVKLNDPAGELHGPGHDMDDVEYETECFHYGNSTNDPLPIKMESLFLRDFANKPADYIDSAEDEFATKYPHGIPNAHNRRHVGPTPQIRNGDRVRLMVQRPTPEGIDAEIMRQICTDAGIEGYGPGMSLPRPRERFFAEVVSITAFGMVTVQCLHDLNHIRVFEGDLLGFPVTRVIGVKHGPNWP